MPNVRTLPLGPKYWHQISRHWIPNLVRNFVLASKVGKVWANWAGINIRISYAQVVKFDINSDIVI